MEQTFWLKAINDPIAVATFILAIVTTAAVIAPTVTANRERAREAKRARLELVSLLSALASALNEAVREPAWSADAGVDIVVNRILQPDLLGSLAPRIAHDVVTAVMMTQRSLHHEDKREVARRTQNDAQFKALKAEIASARDAVQKVSGQIDAVDNGPPK